MGHCSKMEETVWTRTYNPVGHLFSRQAPHLAGSSPQIGTSDGIRIRITPVTGERPKPLDDTGM